MNFDKQQNFDSSSCVKSCKTCGVVKMNFIILSVHCDDMINVIAYKVQNS